MSPWPQIVALLPMRHDSERVPGKNYRSFAGVPLYHHVMHTLIACPLLAGVVIDTDSQAIMDDAAAAFPGTRLLERPKHLRNGNIPMNDVLMQTTARVTADYYLQTHSTNPLLTTATVTRAIEAFIGSIPQHDSLFSVKRLQTRLWDAEGRPLNHDPAHLLRTQDLPPVFEENSCLYIFSREGFVRRNNRIGSRPLLFEMNQFESWDIDVEEDFQIAELLFRAREQSQGASP